MRVNITLDDNVKQIADVFSKAQKDEFRGFFKLVGWELRRSSEVHIFHNPVRNSYFALSGDSVNLNIHYHTQESEHVFSRLRLASIDALMGTGTPSVIASGSLIEYQGMTILITAPSKSGKTTFITQLINAGVGFRLVAEDRMLLTGEGAFNLTSHEGYVRKEALTYLGIDGNTDRSIDFRDYIGTLGNVPKIDFVLMPELNLHGHYETSPVMLQPESVISDLMLQHLEQNRVGEIMSLKRETLERLPQVGHRFRFSVDPHRTAGLLNGILRTGEPEELELVY